MDWKGFVKRFWLALILFGIGFIFLVSGAVLKMISTSHPVILLCFALGSWVLSAYILRKIVEGTIDRQKDVLPYGLEKWITYWIYLLGTAIIIAGIL